MGPAAIGERDCQRIRAAGMRAPREHAWLVLLARNLVFLVIVLVHGFRRLLPPW